MGTKFLLVLDAGIRRLTISLALWDWGKMGGLIKIFIIKRVGPNVLEYRIIIRKFSDNR